MTTMVTLLIILGIVFIVSGVVIYLMVPYVVKKIFEVAEREEMLERQERINKYTTMTYGDESSEEVERMYKEAGL